MGVALFMRRSKPRKYESRKPSANASSSPPCDREQRYAHLRRRIFLSRTNRATDQSPRAPLRAGLENGVRIRPARSLGKLHQSDYLEDQSTALKPLEIALIAVVALAAISPIGWPLLRSRDELNTP